MKWQHNRWLELSPLTQKPIRRSMASQRKPLKTCPPYGNQFQMHRFRNAYIFLPLSPVVGVNETGTSVTSTELSPPERTHTIRTILESRISQLDLIYTWCQQEPPGFLRFCANEVWMVPFYNTVRSWVLSQAKEREFWLLQHSMLTFFFPILQLLASLGFCYWSVHASHFRIILGSQGIVVCPSAAKREKACQSSTETGGWQGTQSSPFLCHNYALFFHCTGQKLKDGCQDG